MLTERAFDAGPVSLNYAEGPSSGPPLVLLHGGTLRWQSFLPVIPLLGWRWHIYALDARGHGRSGHADAYRIADYAQDLTRFLRAVVREPAVLLAHSFGAAVAVQVAAETPEAVRAVVLEDPGFFVRPLAALAGGGYYGAFAKNQELLRSGRSRDEIVAALDPATMNAVARRSRAATLLQLDPDMLATWLDDSMWDDFDRDRDAFLARVGCPALLLQADPAMGGVLTDAQADHAVALLADCALVRLPGVGHLPHSAQPLAFVQLVTDFLESLRAEADRTA